MWFLHGLGFIGLNPAGLNVANETTLTLFLFIHLNPLSLRSLSEFSHLHVSDLPSISSVCIKDKIESHLNLKCIFKVVICLFVLFAFALVYVLVDLVGFYCFSHM